MQEEGVAILNNLTIRDEVLGNCERDIGIIGSIFKFTDDRYIEIYDKYKAGQISRDTAARQLGDLYRNAVADKDGRTYTEFYGEECRNNSQ
jgi:hypothetical protein